ncbi:SDA1-domain-containing protein [Fimicolochytrium jonesii]|uniref:SDA1-domain-containing protein n=1 Tax=Fimicolochytrium jonesii TaxID=1396493 RepID=UPI0022FF107C|nr:SDA1-domain-containing protein [Fimicolochytrium jonesii]KAI8822925.1 SDA1-domain-containing protein [Fimicolochytrium jonesii]
MVKRSRAEFLASNLPQLQNLMKRDPRSYEEEFSQQWRHYESELAIFRLKPDSEAKEFADLITFISHVSQCYTQQCAEFPQQIMDLLSTHYQILEPDLRKTMVQALVLLRNKDLISATSLLSLFFTLFRAKDKQLRALLHNHIVNDIKNANAKSKNNKLNKTLQNFMYNMLKDSNEVAAKKSLEVMIDLYGKNVWNDAKTVNVIVEACFSPSPKLCAPALHFFLGTNEKKDEDEDSDTEAPNIESIKHMMHVNKKKKSKKTALDKAMATVKRKDRARARAEIFNFSALHLVNDPQGFAEKLFSRLKHTTSTNAFRFELRLQMMNLVSRLIGVHKLILFGFYEYVVSFLKPHQREVTAILAYVAQSSHDLVPPDALAPVVQAIADNFVWNNVSSEVVTAGLNGLREICARCPLAMSESLLQSLIEDYKNTREKGPMNAARSLLGLYREVNPEMLKKKDRGRSAAVNLKDFKPARYGEVLNDDVLEVADMLDPRRAKAAAKEATADKQEDGWEGWEEASDEEVVDGEDDEDKEGWEDVSSEGEKPTGEDGWEGWEEASLDGGDEKDSDAEADSDAEEEEEEAEEVVVEETEEITVVETTEGAAKDAEPSPPKKQKLGLAAEKILTDADHRKLRKIQQLKAANKMAGLSFTPEDIDVSSDDEEGDEDSDTNGDVVDVSRIMRGIRRKDDYEARLASIKSGREDKTYGSRKGKEERSSKTNREKAKTTKAFMMVVHKRSVVGKAKRSLREKQKVLRQHITKQKKQH